MRRTSLILSVLFAGLILASGQKVTSPRIEEDCGSGESEVRGVITNLKTAKSPKCDKCYITTCCNDITFNARLKLRDGKYFIDNWSARDEQHNPFIVEAREKLVQSLMDPDRSEVLIEIHAERGHKTACFYYREEFIQ